MQQVNELDHLVGKIAGNIYSDICTHFPVPPLLLVPSLSYKVRKILEQVTDVRLLTKDQKAELAKDIQISIVPMLFSFEIEADLIEKIMPTIESAAFKSLS